VYRIRSREVSCIPFAVEASKHQGDPMLGNKISLHDRKFQDFLSTMSANKGMAHFLGLIIGMLLGNVHN
jgi:hypothetical protein